VFEGIAGSIVHGVAGTLWTMLAAVPLPVWLILFFALIVFGVLVRYLTDVKVDFYLAAIVFVLCLVIYYREHWIEMGASENAVQLAKITAEMNGYKQTEGLIQACYAKNMSVPYLWDRKTGKCERADGELH
jgi:hypothetical protein